MTFESGPGLAITGEGGRASAAELNRSTCLIQLAVSALGRALAVAKNRDRGR